MDKRLVLNRAVIEYPGIPVVRTRKTSFLRSLSLVKSLLTGENAEIMLLGNWASGH